MNVLSPLHTRFKERIYVIFLNKNILQENSIGINDLTESNIHLLPILYHFLGWHSKPALGLLYIASLHVPSIPGIQTAHTRHSSILQPLAALPLLDHLCLLILSANIPYVPWMVGSVMTLMGTQEENMKWSKSFGDYNAGFGALLLMVLHIEKENKRTRRDGPCASNN